MQVRSKRRQDIVADTCRAFPTASNGSLARKLTNDHPALFQNIEVARNALRYHQGTRGSVARKRAETRGTARDNRPSGKLPPLPESLAKPLDPYVLDGRRILVLSDMHFPFQDNAAIEAALEYGDKFHPDTILLNGDSLDFESISRFVRDPRGPGIKDELQSFAQFLGHLRHRFPRARKAFRKGNHEERWEHFLWTRAAEILSIAEFAWEKLAGFAENRVEIIHGRRPVMAGLLPIWHGHEKGKQLSAPVNQARGMFLKYLCSALEGHGHRQSEHTERTADDRHISCWSTGCLCGMWPEYARINKWSHGFATVEVATDGTYQVELKRIIDGKVF